MSLLAKCSTGESVHIPEYAELGKADRGHQLTSADFTDAFKDRAIQTSNDSEGRRELGR